MKQDKITFYYKGQPLEAESGDVISVALLRNNITNLNLSFKMNRSRGIYCGVGRCQSCLVKCNGKWIRACQVLIEDGMRIGEESL